MAKLIISQDGVTLREVLLDRDHISLGRRPYNHIVIDNLSVSGDHAVFQYVDGAFYVEDLNSTNGTAVNGMKVKRQELRHGDTVKIAKFSLQFCDPPDDPPSPRPIITGVLHSVLRVIGGAAPDKVVQLRKPVTTLGKPGIAVARITRQAENFVLRYVEGDMPLMCNGNALTTKDMLLMDGDLIELAGVQMRFEQNIGQSTII